MFKWFKWAWEDYKEVWGTSKSRGTQILDYGIWAIILTIIFCSILKEF